MQKIGILKYTNQNESQRGGVKRVGGAPLAYQERDYAFYRINFFFLCIAEIELWQIQNNPVKDHQPGHHQDDDYVKTIPEAQIRDGQDLVMGLG